MNSSGKFSLMKQYCLENNIVCSDKEYLKEHSSFHIGGKAALFVEPATVTQIGQVITKANELEIPLLTLGKGSNVLFSDKGYHGVVLHLGKRYSNIELIGDDTIFCESGASLNRLCLFAMENSLSGMEPLYGIPGSVGGAVYMNAGAYGGEMKDILFSAQHVDSNGKSGLLQKDKLRLSYRHSAYTDNGYIITGATVKLKKGDRDQIQEKMECFMARRREKQPLEYPSAGSTFKRPEGNYASALIDQCGLKGLQSGGAMVSKKHAGFIINYDNATCRDVLELIGKVQDEVEKKSGVSLECEVKMIGEEE